MPDEFSRTIEEDENIDFSAGSSDEYVPGTDEEAEAAAEEQNDVETHQGMILYDLEMSAEVEVSDQNSDTFNKENAELNVSTRKRKVPNCENFNLFHL